MLTAVILTLNEERHITDCINSVQWADQVVVFDSFSTDATPTLAQQAGARLIQHPFENYSQQRDAALQAVEADWVFFIDADERSTPESAEEIRRRLQHPDTKAGWWIPRHNYIFGHRMRGAGWWPDYQLRLLQRERATYDHKRAVHEVAALEGEVGYLQAPLIHYNYETLQQFVEKQRRYTDYDVDILEARGIRPRFYTPYRQGLHHFWWRFIILSGWRDGIYGITLSALMAYYEMIKYQKLLERIQK